MKAVVKTGLLYLWCILITLNLLAALIFRGPPAQIVFGVFLVGMTAAFIYANWSKKRRVQAALAKAEPDD